MKFEVYKSNMWGAEVKSALTFGSRMEAERYARALQNVERKRYGLPVVYKVRAIPPLEQEGAE